MESHLTYFKSLSRYFYDDAEKCLHVAELTLQSVEKASRQVKEACETHNVSLLRDGFHALRGSLPHLDMIEYTEQFPKYDDPELYEKSEKCLADIQTQVGKVKQYLSNHKN